jgi:hypothetical protein
MIALIFCRPLVQIPDAMAGADATMTVTQAHALTHTRISLFMDVLPSLVGPRPARAAHFRFFYAT